MTVALSLWAAFCQAEDSPSPRPGPGDAVANTDKKFSFVRHSRHGEWETYDVVDVFFERTRARYAQHRRAAEDDSGPTVRYWCDSGGMAVFMVVAPDGTALKGHDEQGEHVWEVMADNGAVATLRPTFRLGVLSPEVSNELADMVADKGVLRLRVSSGRKVRAAVSVELGGFDDASSVVRAFCVPPAGDDQENGGEVEHDAGSGGESGAP